MEQKSTVMLKASMNSGVVLAGISILFAVLIWVTNLVENLGLMANVGIGLISLFVTVVMLIILTKRYRNIYLGGEINFREAFFFGLLVIVFSTVISSLYSYIFNNFIDPGYQERILLSMQDKVYQFMSSKGLSDDQIEETLNQMQADGTPTPVQVLKQSIIFGLVGGTFMSLISSAIVKKRKEDENAFDEAMEEVKSEE